MTPSALADKITAADPVRRWRYEELVRAGYHAYDALVLSAKRDIDLHTATALLGQGCPAETALRILL